MTRQRMITAALALGLAGLTPACGDDGGGGETDAAGWIDGMIPDTGSPKPPPSGDEDYGDDDDDGEELEDEMFWEAFTVVEAGVSLSGDGELLVIEGGVETCSILHQVSSLQPLDDCPGCDFAFEIEFSEVEVEVGDACPIDPAAIEGMRSKIGFVPPETLMRDAGDGWQEGGFAELAEGEFIFELELESFAP